MGRGCGLGVGGNRQALAWGEASEGEIRADTDRRRNRRAVSTIGRLPTADSHSGDGTFDKNRRSWNLDSADREGFDSEPNREGLATRRRARPDPSADQKQVALP